MNGNELRSYRQQLQLFQGSLAAQLTALGITLDDGHKIDQPAISGMERGKMAVPEAVAAAIHEGKIQAGNEAPPALAPADGAGRGRGRRRRGAAAEPPPATAAEAETGEPPPGEPPPPSPDEPAPAVAEAPKVEPKEAPRKPADRAPVVRDTPAPATMSPEARTQLERDLRKFFAGEKFLVPIEVPAPTEADPMGRRVEHHEGMIPGLAQLVGYADAYDGRVIEIHADAMARAWADLAADNAAVRRVLLGLTYGGAWRGVLAATLPVVYAIAAHHGMIPAALGAAPSAAAPAPPQGAGVGANGHGA